jgi:hypothetical protein
MPRVFARCGHVEVNPRIASMIDSALGIESLKYGATDRAKSKSSERVIAGFPKQVVARIEHSD